jgi:hypothetical protein
MITEHLGFTVTLELGSTVCTDLEHTRITVGGSSQQGLGGGEQVRDGITLRHEVHFFVLRNVFG